MSHEIGIEEVKPRMEEYHRKLEKSIRRKPLYGTLITVGAVGTVAAVVVGLAREELIATREAQKNLATLQPAHEEKVPANNKFTIVFEGQKQPRCVGDIERTVPQIDKRGELTGLSVFCKPEAAEPAK